MCCPLPRRGPLRQLAFLRRAVGLFANLLPCAAPWVSAPTCYPAPRRGSLRQLAILRRAVGLFANLLPCAAPWVSSPTCFQKFLPFSKNVELTATNLLLRHISRSKACCGKEKQELCRGQFEIDPGISIKNWREVSLTAKYGKYILKPISFYTSM